MGRYASRRAGIYKKIIPSGIYKGLHVVPNGNGGDSRQQATRPPIETGRRNVVLPKVLFK
jgi:hypothetical protein